MSTSTSRATTARLTGAFNTSASSQIAGAALTSWQSRHPILAEYGSVADLATSLRRSHPHHANAVVTALLAEARHGDRLAGETILNATMYVVVGVSRRWGSRFGEDAMSDVLTDAVEVIADFAANGASEWPIGQLGNRLQCRAARRAKAEARCAPIIRVGTVATTWMNEDGVLFDPPARPYRDSAEELLNVLAAAVERGTISSSEASVLASNAFVGSKALGVAALDKRRQRENRRAVGRLVAAAPELDGAYVSEADLSDAA